VRGVDAWVLLRGREIKRREGAVGRAAKGFASGRLAVAALIALQIVVSAESIGPVATAYLASVNVFERSSDVDAGPVVEHAADGEGAVKTAQVGLPAIRQRGKTATMWLR
jgi:hypothetical protein